MKNIEQEAIRLIKLKMKEKGWNSADMARKMGVHQSTVAKMLQSNFIKLGRLNEFCDLLNFNFLRALADQLELNDPPKFSEEAASSQRIRDLEIENTVLLKALRK